MKRILIVVLSALMLSGCAEKEKEGHSSMVVTAGGEVVSAYLDGEDVTEKRKALEAQTEEAVSGFLNRERDELEFDMFFMLEQDGRR
ncbi:lipoprotein, partial [Robinsoniella sp. RHS]|uniref:lipoprotein n=1 Tax=Robinsoniella sp. RHS TaxID=1504536 RepID=UPI000649C9A1